MLSSYPAAVAGELRKCCEVTAAAAQGRERVRVRREGGRL